MISDTDDSRYKDITDISYTYMRYKDFRDIRYTDARYTDISCTATRYTDIRYTDVRYTDIRYTDTRPHRYPTHPTASPRLRAFARRTTTLPRRPR